MGKKPDRPFGIRPDRAGRRFRAPASIRRHRDNPHDPLARPDAVGEGDFPVVLVTIDDYTYDGLLRRSFRLVAQAYFVRANLRQREFGVTQ